MSTSRYASIFVAGLLAFIGAVGLQQPLAKAKFMRVEISEQDRSKALAEAFGKAKKEADLLGRAAGTEIGGPSPRVGQRGRPRRTRAVSGRRAAGSSGQAWL